MIKDLIPSSGMFEKKKWLIAGIAAGIAIAAAVVSVLVYFSKKDKEETEIEEDCFVD